MEDRVYKCSKSLDQYTNGITSKIYTIAQQIKQQKQLQPPIRSAGKYYQVRTVVVVDV